MDDNNSVAQSPKRKRNEAEPLHPISNKKDSFPDNILLKKTKSLENQQEEREEDDDTEYEPFNINDFPQTTNANNNNTNYQKNDQHHLPNAKRLCESTGELELLEEDEKGDNTDDEGSDSAASIQEIIARRSKPIDLTSTDSSAKSNNNNNNNSQDSDTTDSQDAWDDDHVRLPCSPKNTYNPPNSSRDTLV